MTIHHLLILITLIVPGILMPMEKELGKKRPAEDILEHEVTKVSRLGIDPLDLQEETMQDAVLSLLTPLSQATPVSTPDSPLSSLNDKKSFRCDHAGCNYAAVKKHHLTDHKRTHTGEKPFKCDYDGCNFAAAQSSTLGNHKRTHSAEKPFKCDYVDCNYAARKKSDLTSHKRTHTGEKPFKCDYEGCNYAAVHSNNLTTHMKKHTSFIAALNMEKNQSSKRLAEDILEHEVTKVLQDSLVSLPTPLIATINQLTAGTPYSPLSSLDEKPFKCDHADCNYATKYKSNLATHKRTHTSEKRFKCDYDGCNYAAARQTTLISHKRTHTGDKPFKCDQCDYAAIQKIQLARHKKKEHSNNAIDNITSLPTPLIAALNQVTPVSTPLPDIFNNQEENIMEEKS